MTAKPLVSVIIPAYNEEKWLPVTLNRLKEVLNAVGEPSEVIVVDNNSKDRTAKIASDHKAVVLFEPFNQISRARNRGAKNASGRFLIFLDADTLIHENLFRHAIDLLKTGRYCGGGATVTLYERVPVVIGFGMRVWNTFSRNAKIAAGCFIFCLKEGFEAVGGFSEQVFAGEEIWFSRRLRSWGRGVSKDFEIINAYPIVTSSRKIKWFSPLQIVVIILMLVFPVTTRFRSLCAFWYRRPEK